MGYLIGQFAQAIPVPGGVGAIDAGVTGAVVLYGGEASVSAAGEVISHGLALIIPILVGAVAFALLPREINRTHPNQGTRVQGRRVRHGWGPRHSRPAAAHHLDPRSHCAS